MILVVVGSSHFTQKEHNKYKYCVNILKSDNCFNKKFYLNIQKQKTEKYYVSYEF